MDSHILNAGLDILNTAHDMAKEFGEQWLKPVNEQLHKRYPHLSQSELDQYNAHCVLAMRYGHGEMPVCWQECAGKESAAQKLFGKRMRDHYPWVSSDNIGRLFSQGYYYASMNGDLMLRGEITLRNVTEADKQIIAECLRATVDGPFFSDRVFYTLISLMRDEVRAILDAWPDVTVSRRLVWAINDCLLNLTGYPHRKDHLWSEYSSVSKDEVLETLDRWRSESDFDRFFNSRM